MSNIVNINNFLKKINLFFILKHNFIIFDLQLNIFNKKIFLSPYVFIFRQETYIIVDYLINNFLNYNLKILELGTGSGAIVLILSRYFNNWDYTCSDKSFFAIKLTYYNILFNNVNIKLLVSNWYINIPNNKYSIIICNPPYISIFSKMINKNIISDPYHSLYSKNNGFYDIYKIISFSRFFLLENSFLIIEHGFNQSYLVRKIFKKNFFYKIITLQDFNGIDRITMGFYKKNRYK